ncbi:MAG: molybdopterin molybdenumtransferase MoeA [Phycisphaerae bacterium]|nr:MAG: molybdopterin molybdenumtransferase MoeA [Phycisphaerae bacterium]
MSASSTPPSMIVREWVQGIRTVSTETVSLVEGIGRVLARPITADRDHPPVDMSAMDGYAVRYDDPSERIWKISDTSARIGQPRVHCEPGQAVYIVTGAPVPWGADTVIRVEDVIVESGNLRLKPSARVIRGANIRRQGENVATGSIVVEAGVPIYESVISTGATFGISVLEVFRKVKVGLIVTGDELLGADENPQEYQIRDGSGPAILAALNRLFWVRCDQYQRVGDDLSLIRLTLNRALEDCDAVILTGGMSMGERDFVPQAVQDVGARLCFHRLPIRPGKPTLGALTPDGKPIVGLPGNPVSTLVTFKRFAMPALRRRAGFKVPDQPVPCVHTTGELPSDAMLWHYKPVRLQADGPALISRWVSSADVTSAACSDGFIEIPPVPRTENCFFRFYAW